MEFEQSVRQRRDDADFLRRDDGRRQFDDAAEADRRSSATDIFVR